MENPGFAGSDFFGCGLRVLISSHVVTKYLTLKWGRNIQCSR